MVSIQFIGHRFGDAEHIYIGAAEEKRKGNEFKKYCKKYDYYLMYST